MAAAAQDDTEISVQATEGLVTQQSTNEPEFESTDVAGVLTVASGSAVPLSSTSTPTVPPPATASAQPRRPVELRNPIKIALSYRGETNERVKLINDLVHTAISTPDFPDPVFYAPRFQAALALIDARRVLRPIYEKAALVIVFLSPTYHHSTFCYHEWRTITNRFMVGGDDQQYERLLLFKLGDFDVTKFGLFPDDSYIDATNISEQEVADIILERWHMVEKLFNQ